MPDIQAKRQAKRTIDVSPLGDITAKREQLKLETQATLAKKFEADTANSIDWQPTFSRIKIKPDPEALSSWIVVSQADSLIRGTVVSVGPDVGKKDGRTVEKFYPGQRILYIRSHVMTYEGADGITHHFLKENADVSSVIAIEPRVNVGDQFQVTNTFTLKCIYRSDFNKLTDSERNKLIAAGVAIREDKE